MVGQTCAFITKMEENKHMRFFSTKRCYSVLNRDLGKPDLNIRARNPNKVSSFSTDFSFCLFPNKLSLSLGLDATSINFFLDSFLLSEKPEK
jgi:hypothetical protein